MTVTLKQLETWLAAPSENEHLEFKEAKNRFDFEKLVDYCVALANECGGHMVLGVSDKLPRKVVGTSAFDTPERTVGGLYERLHFRVLWTELNHPDGRVLVFTVPSRPIGQPIEYNGRYLMRAGEDLVPMSPDFLQRIFAEGQPVFEARIALNGVSAEDIVRLLDTQSYFDLIQLPYPENRQGVIEKFVSEKLIVPSSVGFTITNLGALLFAKNLDEFESLSRKAVRVTTYVGNDKLTIKKDTIGNKGYAVDFERLIDYINGQLPSNEVIGKALRESVPMFPEIAIRELVTNALIHQDLDQTGGSIHIDIYANRLEISNPGLPRIAPDRFIDEYQSLNDRMADLMRRLRICEEKGSGIDKVVSSIEAFQLPAPDIRVGQIRTSVVLFAHKKFSDMNRSDRLRACYQHCVLRYLIAEKMTNQSLRVRFGLTDRQTDIASKIITTALDEKLIKLDDPISTSKRYTRYNPYWA
ncbi:MAG: putative DNA binding domain-containing protein [Deltaproteobacteria bacterium]|nr:putative DNA binding domain-containing protein [Candidatus Tharpella aukensis]